MCVVLSLDIAGMVVSVSLEVFAVKCSTVRREDFDMCLEAEESLVSLVRWKIHE